MGMNFKRTTVGALAGASLLLLTACGGASGAEGSADGGTLRLGHGGTPDGVLSLSVALFNERLQEETDGRWTVEDYPSSQLGNERDLVEGVSMGSVDMTLVTNAPIGNFVPEALFYDMPALYQDLDHVHAVAESSLIDDHLAPALLEEDLRLLGITDGGFRSITNSVHEIKTVDDLDGIRMRIQESPIISATYEAIPGVTPVPVPVGDIYTSLDQGIADAQENPAILVRDLALQEVQDYMTLTEHSFFPRHLIINEGIWQSMSEEDQQIFMDVAAEMVEFKNEYYVTETDAVLEELEGQGLEVTTPDPSFSSDLQAIMLEEVYPEFYDDIGGGDAAKGEEVIQQIIEMAG